jgi:long-chain acyl-CoA synthetase
MGRTNLASYVHDFAARDREIAYVHRPHLVPVRWTYARVAAAAFRFARELESRGVGKGDRVLVWGPNSPEWVAVFYGSLLRGAIAVPLDDGSSPDFAARVVAQATPSLVVAGPNRCVPAGTSTIALADLEAVIARHDAGPVAAAEVAEADTAQIVFTSGTTAEPRGVIITHGNLLSNLEPLEREIAKYLKWERIFHPIRFLDLLPLSHVFGQFMGIFVPQLLAGEVHFLESLNPAKIVETIRDERISVAVAVPRILQSLESHVERDAAARGELDRLRERIAASSDMHPLKRWLVFRRVHRMFGLKFWAFVAGGATLDVETETFWRRLGFAVVQGYGMTETASLVSVNHPFKMSRGSIGKVLPGQEIKLGPGGEILVRGRNVTPGYWSTSPDGQSDDEGWFHTGDVGELDAEGNLFFKGRKKNVIVTANGLNVYPEDLEAALNAQPEVLASCVVEVAGPNGPEPAAAVIARGDASALDAAVDRANATLAEFQQIRSWAAWPDHDFPRTATQKVRTPVVAEFLRVRVDGETRAPAPDALADVIARVKRDAGGPLDPSATLGKDLGLDSLARVELLSAIEDRYQIDIDESAFTAATTVADLERLLARDNAETTPPRHRYPRWAQSLPARLVRLVALYLVLLPVTFVMCWVRARGVSSVHRLEGPALFVSNHVVSADAALILSALPGRYRRRLAIAMSGEMLSGWVHPPPGTGYFERARLLAQYVLVVLLFNVFPLPQQSGFRRSFSFAGELTEKGYSVLVFPEGLRTPTGDIHPFRTGAGILATSLGVPVVPVRLGGLYALKARNQKFVRPGTVTVSFGEPLRFAPDDDAARVAGELERAVRDL